jgi:hypothetical protein
VKDLIDEGRKLIEALRREQFPVTAAFWVKLPDSERHRLVIASPVPKELGRLAAYRRLHAIIKSVPLSLLSFEDISVLGPKDSDFEALLSTAVGPVALAMRREGSEFRDVELEDAYVYYV